MVGIGIVPGHRFLPLSGDFSYVCENGKFLVTLRRFRAKKRVMGNLLLVSVWAGRLPKGDFSQEHNLF